MLCSLRRAADGYRRGPTVKRKRSHTWRTTCTFYNELAADSPQKEDELVRAGRVQGGESAYTVSAYVGVARLSLTAFTVVAPLLRDSFLSSPDIVIVPRWRAYLPAEDADRARKRAAQRASSPATREFFSSPSSPPHRPRPAPPRPASRRRGDAPRARGVAGTALSSPAKQRCPFQHGCALLRLKNRWRSSLEITNSEPVFPIVRGQR
jgi:hypothetical protein